MSLLSRTGSPSLIETMSERLAYLHPTQGNPEQMMGTEKLEGTGIKVKEKRLGSPDSRARVNDWAASVVSGEA